MLLLSTAAYSQSSKYAKTPKPGSNKASTKMYCSHLRLAEYYKDKKSWTKETSDVLSAHARFYDSLGKEGILIFAGRTDYEPSDKRLWGMVVIKAETEKEANKIFSQDPVIINDIMRNEVLEFTLPIRYFENLK
jgi:uncharacterized protein YciI